MVEINDKTLTIWHDHYPSGGMWFVNPNENNEYIIPKDYHIIDVEKAKNLKIIYE